jgi:hypothetical protein
VIKFKAEKIPNSFEVVIFYLMRFGIIKLVAIIIYLFIFTEGLPTLLFWFFLPVVFFIADLWLFPSERIIYQVNIDKDKGDLTVYHYLRRKKKTIIPFKKLYFEFLHKTKSTRNGDEWIIFLGKKPFPMIGKMYSYGSYSAWSKSQMEDLSKELKGIASKYETWSYSSSSTKRFFPRRWGVKQVNELTQAL